MTEIDLAQGSVADSCADALVQDTHSRIWLDALVNNTLTFVLIADRDGRLLCANEVANRCLGGGRETIIGQTFHDLFAPDFADERIRCIRRVLQTKRPLAVQGMVCGVWRRAVMRPVPPDDRGPDRVLIVSSPVARGQRKGEPQNNCELVQAKVNDMGSLAALSERELEALALIGEGLSTAEIAKRLNRSLKTVEWHRASLGRKLRVTNRVKLARIAIQAGLAPLPGAQMVEDEHLNQKLRAEIAKREQAQQALRAIEAGTAAATGEEFFRSLVRHLATTLGVKYAIVSEIVDEDMTLCRTVAFWAGEDIAENTEYQLAGTPCEDVAVHGVRHFRSGVRERFPNDHVLVELGVDSYLGTPLHDAGGRPIGILAVLHHEPLCEGLEPETILRIFASRAAAELQRLRTQQQLRTSEAKNRAILASTLDPLVTIDHRNIIQAASDSVEAVFGWKPGELVGQNVKVLMPEPYRSQHEQFVADYLHTGRSNILGRSRELQAVRKDGSIFPCEITLWRVDLPGQVDPLFTAILRDITELKRAGRAVQVSEARLKAFIESAPVGMVIFDDQLRYLKINEELAQMNGLPAEDHLGKTMQDVVPDIAPGLEAMYRRILTTGEPVLNTEVSGEVSSQPGVARHWITSQFRIPGDEPETSMLGVIVVEITERERAAEKLRDSEERRRSLVETMNEGLGMLDPNGITTYVNDRLCCMLGYSSEELVGRPVTDLLDEPNRGILEHQLAKRRNGESSQYEIAFTKKDGEQVATIMSPQPIFDADGRVRGSVAVITQITERRRAKGALPVGEERQRVCGEDTEVAYGSRRSAR